MVAYAAADPFSYLLTKASKDAAMDNGILKSYKDNKAYNEPVQRVVKTAESVRVLFFFICLIILACSWYLLVNIISIHLIETLKL